MTIHSSQVLIHNHLYLKHIFEKWAKNDFEYFAAIVSLGHIAIMMPDKFPVHIKNLVSRNLVKQLLMKGASEPHDIEEPWVNYDKLPMETKCKFQVGLFKSAKSA